MTIWHIHSIALFSFSSRNVKDYYSLSLSSPQCIFPFILASNDSRMSSIVPLWPIYLVTTRNFQMMFKKCFKMSIYFAKRIPPSFSRQRNCDIALKLMERFILFPWYHQQKWIFMTVFFASQFMSQESSGNILKQKTIFLDIFH